MPRAQDLGESLLEKVRREVGEGREEESGKKKRVKTGRKGTKKCKQASKQTLARALRARERNAQERGSNPSFRGLKPVFVYPARREYRLSVVRLGVLHSSKYLGIFEESRVPKKTVYSVERWRDLSRERTSVKKEREREKEKGNEGPKLTRPGSEPVIAGRLTSTIKKHAVGKKYTQERYTGKGEGEDDARSRQRLPRRSGRACALRAFRVLLWILGWSRTDAFSIFLVIFPRRVREIEAQLTAANDRVECDVV